MSRSLGPFLAEGLSLALLRPLESCPPGQWMRGRAEQASCPTLAHCGR